MGCVKARNDLASVGGVALTPFALLFWILLLVRSVAEVFLVVQHQGETHAKWTFSAGLGVAVGSFRALTCLLGVSIMGCATALHVAVVYVGLKIVIVFDIMELIAQWVVWTLWLLGFREDETKWKPSALIIAYMVLTTVGSVALFIAAWWLLSAIKSLKFVVGVGGNGWEGEDFMTIRENQELFMKDDV